MEYVLFRVYGFTIYSEREMARQRARKERRVLKIYDRRDRVWSVARDTTVLCTLYCSLWAGTNERFGILSMLCIRVQFAGYNTYSSKPSCNHIIGKLFLEKVGESDTYNHKWLGFFKYFINLQ